MAQTEKIAAARGRRKVVTAKEVAILAFCSLAIVLEILVIITYSGTGAQLSRVVGMGRTATDRASQPPSVFRSSETISAPVVSPVEDAFGDPQVVARMKQGGLQ